MNDAASTQRNRALGAVWGRGADMVFAQTDDEAPMVDILRFPKTWKPWAPAHECVVHVTAGMSDREMPGVEPGLPRRVELSAYSTEIKLSSPEGRDLVAWALHTLAHTPWREEISLAPLDTVSWGAPLIEGSDMSSFFLALPEGVDMERLREASGKAELFIQVVPISDAERKLAVEEGSEALVVLLERCGVPPYFDLGRRSCR